MTDVAPRETEGTPPGPPQDTHAGRPVDRTVFGVAAVAVAAFVLWGAIDPTAMGDTTTSTLTWLEKSFGWLFVLTTALFVLFSAYLALSRYGNIRLGPDDSTPEFSTFSWVSMMFATGMGIGLIFWGVAEPLTHLNTPPLGRASPAPPRPPASRWSTPSSTGACTRGRSTPSSGCPSPTSPTASRGATSSRAPSAR